MFKLICSDKLMISVKKVAVLLSLLAFSIVFSGCSLKKAEETKTSDIQNIKKEKDAASIDSDADSLTDREEEKLGTNKNKADSDGDNLSDFEEVRKWKTDPRSPDSDGDGYTDEREIKNGYDPGGTGQLDSDNDGLGDADEKRIGTNPNKFDSDEDGLSDKEEVDRGINPLEAN